MKRDMDLVRDILFEVEQARHPLRVETLCALREDEELVAYHLELMAARGLLDAELKGAWGKRVAFGTVNGLTWDGQDFLDAMRDDRVWDRAKAAIRESVGSTTFDVAKSTCTAVASALVKAQLGL